MRVLRTPDSRFDGLADWPFEPRYVEIDGPDGERLRVHYVDEGPRDGAPVLLMHGEPTWSYLYRNIIPALAAKGRRAIAPDLIGFGKSDKPAEQSDYTFEGHVKWMSDWLTALDLKNVTLFCQDWGGLHQSPARHTARAKVRRQRRNRSSRITHAGICRDPPKPVNARKTDEIWKLVLIAPQTL